MSYRFIYIRVFVGREADFVPSFLPHNWIFAWSPTPFCGTLLTFLEFSFPTSAVLTKTIHFITALAFWLALLWVPFYSLWSLRSCNAKPKWIASPRTQTTNFAFDLTGCVCVYMFGFSARCEAESVVNGSFAGCLWGLCMICMCICGVCGRICSVCSVPI
jgi:hypothetical protein